MKKRNVLYNNLLDQTKTGRTPDRKRCVKKTDRIFDCSAIFYRHGIWNCLLSVCAAVVLIALFGGCGQKADKMQTEKMDTTNVSSVGQTSALPIQTETITVNGVSFKMVAVEGGTFTMGCTDEQGNDCESDEKPAHQVTLSSFYIGETEVTQALWKAVMGTNPRFFEGDNLPVACISWDDCQKFIKMLNELTGKKFRLPTEAEWEYAARGGNQSRGYKYSGSDNIDSVAWYDGNSGDDIHPVKTKEANELGLYDMSGNVWEWCQDWYGGYTTMPQTDPRGPTTGSSRVLRGGVYINCYASDCYVFFRHSNNPDVRHCSNGFRLVLVQ